MIRFWSLLGIFLGLSLIMQAQTAPGILENFSTSRGGGIHYVTANGPFLYVAEGSSLVVYDTRATPYVRSFERRFASPIVDMAWHGGFLYVAANHDGLTKWDVSIPIKPALVSEYRPSEMDIAIQSIDFMGDTIVAAAGNGIVFLHERTGLVSTYDRVGRIAEQGGLHGRVTCGALFGHYYAAAIAGKDRGVGQGIHTYLISPEMRLNFHHYDSAEPGKILKMAQAQRLIVFGGQSFAQQSHLMGLNVTDPGHPALAFCDTVRATTVPAAVNPGIMVGDTLLVPFAGRFGGICGFGLGGIALYSLRDPASPRYLGQISLPHPPLHLALVGKQLHVAQGAEGLVTYDWSALHIQDCAQLPELGRTRPNGGFCTGADALGDKLVTADGEAGFSLHLIQDRKTIATRSYAGLGRVDQVRLLSDGLHAACWVGASPGDTLIVVRLDDGKVVGSLDGSMGSHRVLGWKDRFVVARDDRSGFDVLDLRNPAKPKKEQGLLMKFNDLAVDELGHVMVSTEHNIRLFEFATQGLTDVLSYVKWGEGFGAVAAFGGDYYAYSSKRGLLKCHIVKDKAGFSQLKEDLVWKLPHAAPDRLAADENALLVGYHRQGVYALDRNSLATIGYYRTGLDYKGMPSRSLQDIFCRAGKAYVVEYYGQVTVLKFTVPAKN